MNVESATHQYVFQVLVMPVNPVLFVHSKKTALSSISAEMGSEVSYQSIPSPKICCNEDLGM